MSQIAVDHFLEGIQTLTERMKREYDLTLAEALGCLECIKH